MESDRSTTLVDGVRTEPRGDGAGEAPPATSSAVRVDHVSKTYETRGARVEAVRDASFELADGEFVSLVGPSGCGKSTLLSILAGLLPPSSGSVSVLGRPVEAPVTDVGVVFQQPLLLPWRSVLRNVLLQIEARRLDTEGFRDRALELLDRVGLDGFSDQHPAALSGGMSQRVSICRALIHDPPLLLMDEPFGALDALTRDEMNLDFQRLSYEEGKTVVFVTHSISEAVFLSDRVIVVSPRPARVAAVIDVDLPRPRGLEIRETPEYAVYTRAIREEFQRMGLLRERRV
jgi:NitT/TauT family transport system ATP-binding protein